MIKITSPNGLPIEGDSIRDSITGILRRSANTTLAVTLTNQSGDPIGDSEGAASAVISSGLPAGFFETREFVVTNSRGRFVVVTSDGVNVTTITGKASKTYRSFGDLVEDIYFGGATAPRVVSSSVLLTDVLEDSGIPGIKQFGGDVDFEVFFYNSNGKSVVENIQITAGTAVTEGETSLGSASGSDLTRTIQAEGGNSLRITYFAGVVPPLTAEGSYVLSLANRAPGDGTPEGNTIAMPAATDFVPEVETEVSNCIVLDQIGRTVKMGNIQNTPTAKLILTPDSENDPSFFENSFS